jgi:hypothetical protein
MTDTETLATLLRETHLRWINERTPEAHRAFERVLDKVFELARGRGRS